jgi:murein DD-endopeptidase MepM/ murein hydrolase activator NlpD
MTMKQPHKKLAMKPFHAGFILLLLLLLTFLPAQARDMAQEGPIYIVQEGDSLNYIASIFGISADELQTANGITDPNALVIGQQLVIPGLEGISGVLTTMPVPFGTSLQLLARQYKISVKDLVTLNKKQLTSPSGLIAGIKIILPIDENQDPLTPIATVHSDESILETAIRSGVSPWQLVNENQLAATWDALPGDVLFSSSADDSQRQSILPGISEITINPLPIIQGETLEIEIKTTEDVQISGMLDENEMPFFQEDDTTIYGFNGIHAMTDPGMYALQITAELPNGSIHTIEQLVLVQAGGYGTDPTIYVDDIYLDPETIAAEDAIVNEILAVKSPDRYWDGPFQYPIDEPGIVGYYGQRRSYNDGALFYYHTGMDFGVFAQNLNIYAPAAGKVVLAEEMTIRGNAVIIDHGWGIYSGYWHLSEFDVQKGDWVEPGDVLGLIGNTGRSAGPHLHFEINVNGTPINPQTWLEQTFP